MVSRLSGEGFDSISPHTLPPPLTHCLFKFLPTLEVILNSLLFCFFIFNKMAFISKTSTLAFLATVGLLPLTQAAVPAIDGFNTTWSDDFVGTANSLPNTADWQAVTGTSYPGGAANWGTNEIETVSTQWPFEAAKVLSTPTQNSEANLIERDSTRLAPPTLLCLATAPSTLQQARTVLVRGPLRDWRPSARTFSVRRAARCGSKAACRFLTSVLLMVLDIGRRSGLWVVTLGETIRK